MSSPVAKMRSARANALAVMKDAIREASKNGGVTMTGEILERYEQASDDVCLLDAKLTKAGTVEDAGGAYNDDELLAHVNGGGKRALYYGEKIPLDRSFTELPGGKSKNDDLEGDAAAYWNALATGNFGEVNDRGLSVQRAEQRAGAVGVGATGGYLLPTEVSATIWDLVRPAQVTAAAGVQTIPWQGEGDFNVATQATDVTASWLAENVALTASDITFGVKKFSAQLLGVLVKASIALIEDGGARWASVLQRSIAQAFAHEIDRVVIKGSGVGNEPVGVVNASGTVTTGLNAVPTYDHLVDSVARLAALNEGQKDGESQPRLATIMAPRTLAFLNKTKASTSGVYLIPPPMLADVPILQSTVIPTNQGGTTDRSYFVTADWDETVVAVRTPLQVIPLKERFADTGQIGFLAYARLDTNLMRATSVDIANDIKPV